MTPKKEETTINDEKDDITEVIKNTNENVPRPVILGLQSWVVSKRKKNKNKCKNIVAD